MPRIYKLSRTGLRFIFKIRHHKGHGIHSPFVFNLATKVIEEKLPFYAYNDIKLYMNNCQNRNFKPQKLNHLLLRLVNHFGAKHILEIGSGNGINTLYLTSPSSQIECSCVEHSPKKFVLAEEIYKNWNRNITLYTSGLPNLQQKQDCILIDLNNYNSFADSDLNYILNLVHKKTFIVVKGIRTNRKHRALWKCISNVESRTVELDLFNIGIVFFDDTLYRWKYMISF